MKRGFLYIVVSNSDHIRPSIGRYHHFEIGTLVECIHASYLYEGASEFEDEDGISQSMYPYHVEEIGEI